MDDEVLQNLLRSAYQCELPSEDAVERFVDEFHRRQTLRAMKSSFLDEIQEQATSFFAHFRIPAIAYISVTAIALFFSILILRTPRLNDHWRMTTTPHSPEEWETSFNDVSPYFLQQKIEPVTFDLKKEKEENNFLISPFSYIFKNKNSHSSIKDL
jgi:hypothetical protein